MGKVVFMGFKGFLLRVAEIEKTAGNVQTSSCCCLPLSGHLELLTRSYHESDLCHVSTRLLLCVFMCHVCGFFVHNNGEHVPSTA